MFWEVISRDAGLQYVAIGLAIAMTAAVMGIAMAAYTGELDAKDIGLVDIATGVIGLALIMAVVVVLWPLLILAAVCWLMGWAMGQIWYWWEKSDRESRNTIERLQQAKDNHEV